MQPFGSALSNGTIMLENAVNEQVNLRSSTDNLKQFTRPRLSEKINEKGVTLKNATNHLKGRQKVINDFESRIFLTYSRALPSTSDDNLDRTLTSEPQSISSPIKPTKEKD